MMDGPGGISPDLIEQLATRGDVRRLDRGEILIREGDLSQSLFVLLRGQLLVFTSDRRGREVIYNTLSAGEVLGEMVLDGGRRSASVKALTAVECVEVRGDEIKSFMRAYPEFSEALVFKLIERLRRATSQIRSLALDDVYARTLSAIDELAVVTEGRRTLPPQFTQKQIANRIGATREMVNHIFKRLLREGVLVRGAGTALVVAKPLPGAEPKSN